MSLTLLLPVLEKLQAIGRARWIRPHRFYHTNVNAKVADNLANYSYTKINKTGLNAVDQQLVDLCKQIHLETGETLESYLKFFNSLLPICLEINGQKSKFFISNIIEALNEKNDYSFGVQLYASLDCTKDQLMSNLSAQKNAVICKAMCACRATLQKESTFYFFGRKLEDLFKTINFHSAANQTTQPDQKKLIL